MSNSERRKKFFINPSFQVRFVAYSSIFTIISILVFYLSIHISFIALKREGFKMGLEKSHSYFQLIAEQEQFMNIVFLFTSLFLIFLLTLFGIFISHKIVGPIERLKLYMRNKVKNPKIDELVFRDDDFFQDLADEFNEFCKKNSL